MLDRILALAAFAVLAGFLAVLIYRVPRADLIVIIGITLALAGWDFFFRRRNN